MPDSALFPTDAFRRVLNQVIREEGESLLQYYPVGGYPPLRRYLAGYLLRFGVEARPEEILIVNGSQQGFDLIARTLLDPGDFVAIEQPTYPRAMQVFRSFGAQLLPVPVGRGGPAARRLRAAARAAGAQAVLLPAERPQSRPGSRMGPEVGARGCWRWPRATRCRSSRTASTAASTTGRGRRPPLKAADRAGVVIYIGTFSKILFPGLRLGWLVAPPALVERLQAAKQLADLHTQRADPGGGVPLLRAPAARPPLSAWRRGVRAAARAAAGLAPAPDAGRRHVDRARRAASRCC